MEEEKDVFYVVRKGDIVGVYKTLTDCPSFHSSSTYLRRVQASLSLRMMGGRHAIQQPCNECENWKKGIMVARYVILPSVYTKDTVYRRRQKYLVSRGLTNASHSISFMDVKVKEDLFGRLVPCPLQLPPCEGKKIHQSFSVKEDRGVIEIEGVHEVGSDRVKSLQIDAFRKHVKLEDSLKAQVVTRLPTKHEYCILNFAGSSIGNPGKAGAGAILRSEDGTLVCQLREGVGIATCDEAEFRAVILGLRAALKKGFTQIYALGKSKLVCGWVQGMCKIKDEKMSILCEEARKLKDNFFSFQIKHVLKEQNSEAIAEADLAIYFADGQVHEACHEN